MHALSVPKNNLRSTCNSPIMRKKYFYISTINNFIKNDNVCNPWMLNILVFTPEYWAMELITMFDDPNIVRVHNKNLSPHWSNYGWPISKKALCKCTMSQVLGNKICFTCIKQNYCNLWFLQQLRLLYWMKAKL